jgi:hypothetical protein
MPAVGVRPVAHAGTLASRAGTVKAATSRAMLACAMPPWPAAYPGTLARRTETP